MNRALAHFVAALASVAMISVTGSLTRLLELFLGAAHPRPGAAAVVSGILNFTLSSALVLTVLAPVVSIADHLFGRRWAWPVYLQALALAPLLFCYLVPWSLLFGKLFLLVLGQGTVSLLLPLWIYWGAFRFLERCFGD